MIGHEAIALVLLVDSLWDDYTKSWENEFASAFDAFKLRVAQATKQRREQPTEYWLSYGQWARANSDQAASIEALHKFFAEKMHAAIKPQLKAPVRLFGLLEREIIYMRYRKQWQALGCGAEVVWAEAEMHHVEQHSAGGPTELANGALVHRHCHPKSQKDVAAFAENWKRKLASTPSVSADVKPKSMKAILRELMEDTDSASPGQPGQPV